MTQPKSRAFISFWLIVCMLFSFLPLGCFSGAQVSHAAAAAGQPYLPQLTEERFKECAALVHKDAKREQRSVNANVTLDEDGYVLDATTTNEPNQPVGMCLWMALKVHAVI